MGWIDCFFSFMNYRDQKPILHLSHTKAKIWHPIPISNADTIFQNDSHQRKMESLHCTQSNLISSRKVLLENPIMKQKHFEHSMHWPPLNTRLANTLPNHAGHILHKKS